MITRPVFTAGARGKLYMWLRANGLNASPKEFDNQLRVYMQARKQAQARIYARKK